MNLVELVMLILGRIAPMDITRREMIKSKMFAWYADQTKVKIDAEGNQIEPNFFGKLVAKYGEEWYTLVILALLYVPLTRWLHDYMNPEVDGDDKI